MVELYSVNACLDYSRFTIKEKDPRRGLTLSTYSPLLSRSELPQKGPQQSQNMRTAE
jgi:hypothetical protein